MHVGKHHWVGVVGIAAAVLTMYVSRADLGLTAQLEWAVMGGVTLVTAVSLGHYQYVHDSKSDTDRRPFFESRAIYTSFWGLFWAAFVHTMSILGPGGDSGTGTLRSILPAWFVVGTWIAVGLVAVALGGFNRNLSPRYWAREFRDGRSQGRQGE